MGIAHRDGIESTAAVLHHPLHPVSVALPIGTLVFALAADIVFLATGRMFWTDAAFWLLCAAVVTGVGAAGLGAIDYFAISEVRRLAVARIHALGNLTAIGLAVANAIVHKVVVVPTLPWLAVALSAVTVALIGLTGYLGGKLSYQYRIGQIAASHGGRIPEPIASEHLLSR